MSESLTNRIKETKEFKQKFESLIQGKPWILQKCSLHGMLLIKECIDKVSEESKNQCQEELAEVVAR